MGQTGSETSGLCCPPRPPGSCHCGGRRLGRQCLCLGTEGSSGARPWPSGLGGGGWGGAEGSEEPAMPLQGHAEPGADRTVAPPPPPAQPGSTGTEPEVFWLSLQKLCKIRGISMLQKRARIRKVKWFIADRWPNQNLKPSFLGASPPPPVWKA